MKATGENVPLGTGFGSRGIAVLMLVICGAGLSGCSWFRPSASEKATPQAVWSYIQQRAAKHDLDPYFVYAIAMAESSLRPDADSGQARGMMQLSKPAWETVSTESYRQAWNWQKNIDAGILYLVHCRTFLRQKGHFNYPLLAAGYRYGIYRVQKEGFQIHRLPRPSNKIYRELFAGNMRPVRPVTE